MHGVTGAGKAQRNFEKHEGALPHYFERELRESKGSRSTSRGKSSWHGSVAFSRPLLRIAAIGFVVWHAASLVRLRSQRSGEKTAGAGLARYL